MNPQLTFELMTPIGLIVFGLIGFWYVLPALYRRGYLEAMVPLLLFSAFRYLGALFAIPGLSNGLADTVFAPVASVGDLVVAAIALLGAILLRMNIRLGVLVAWAYLVLGVLDFVNAARLAQQSDLHVHAGAIWPVLLLGGPAFMITLVLLGFVLIRHPGKSAGR